MEDGAAVDKQMSEEGAPEKHVAFVVLSQFR